MLAAAGLYGVLSYLVAQRTREIGIRMALGATAGNVLRLVVGRGFVLMGVGLVIGLAGAMVATRALSGLLFGVGPLDPLSFSAVAVLIGMIALLASVIPGIRAARVEPANAVRFE